MARSMRRSGFTLVELMVAIVVVGIVSIVVYRLFDVTNQNFREVDQLADVNDRIRFATERVRSYVQAAGAQSTPDSALDPWVAPPLPGTARVAGLVPYTGWQNNRDATTIDPDVAAANPNVSFDGIVIMGAVDYPLSFEFAGMAPAGGARIGRIYAHYKGVMKLTGADPFLPGLQAVPALDGALATSIRGNSWASRLLRISDRQGYQQFVQPLTLGNPQGVGLGQYFEVQLPNDGTTFGPKLKAPGQGFFGIDDLAEGDVAYDAGLIDAFWIHAVPDESNPRITNLVRDRLCAPNVALNGFTAGWNPATALASTCGGGAVNERVVLASYVADFQIWFDCADANGGVAGADWSFTWDPNDHSTGDCMDATVPQPGRARAAHIRIALHTRNERRDQLHIQFEDALGAVCDPNNPAACDAGRIESATLRTFDFYPDSPGATRVVVMQTDIELPNFVNRNAL